MKQKIQDLYNKDNNYAHKILLELEELSANSNEIYQYFDEFLCMLQSEKTLVRIRGFRLICYQAKWDKDKKINKNIDVLLQMFDDEIGVAIRQYLLNFDKILIYNSELKTQIEKKLNSINLTKYKKTMQPLIKKDINLILEKLK